MRQVALEAGADFAAFRDAARPLLVEGVAPRDVHFAEGRAADVLPGLGGEELAAARDGGLRIPRGYAALAEQVACHRDPARWELLYRLAWRLVRGGESKLLEIAVDPDVRRAAVMDKAVARDTHKVHAFVRFQPVPDASAPRYVAWHRPEHYVLRRAAPFFTDRFRAMQWSILTPDLAAHWDGESLAFGPGVPRSAAPATEDDFVDMWRSYYASVFNPARIKTRAMQKEMPKRHWPTLPEAGLIASLLHDAPSRAGAMIERAAVAMPSAAPVPRRAPLPVLREGVRACRACELCVPGTQAVPGEGPADARIVLVGEQPGDLEDRAGRPFVGPAGEVLARALAAAGIAREGAYLTNAVKHFRHREAGGRRLHQTPRLRDVAACKPWLDAELEALAPRVVLCLGSTAARALLGPAYRGDEDRGRWFARAAAGADVLATFHPAAALRAADADTRTRIEGAIAEALRSARARAA